MASLRYHIFTHGDVVNAQTWEVYSPKNPVEPPFQRLATKQTDHLHAPSQEAL